jgi:hypothetical protein
MFYFFHFSSFIINFIIFHNIDDKQVYKLKLFIISFSSMLTNSKKNLANQILEKPLTKQKSEVSHSAFAFLFSEIVQYTYNRISSIEDLQARLEELGIQVGQRVLELVACRERITKRETKILGILQVIILLNIPISFIYLF